jgi:hypothetical protein
VTDVATLLVFLHVPKTAGNSVRSVMTDAFGEKDWLDLFLPSRTGAQGEPVHVHGGAAEVEDAVAQLRAQQHDLVGAGVNLPFGVHEVLDRPVTYFSVVREPVARLVSYWHFVARMRDVRPQWSRYARYDFDIGRILADHADVAFENDQVRMLAGTGRLAVTARELELAKRRIEHDFAFVTTTDALAATLPPLLDELGVPCASVPRDNAGDYADPTLLPAHAREAFAEANRLDAELYRWVRDDYLPRRLTRHGG